MDGVWRVAQKWPGISARVWIYSFRFIGALCTIARNDASRLVFIRNQADVNIHFIKDCTYFFDDKRTLTKGQTSVDTTEVQGARLIFVFRARIKGGGRGPFHLADRFCPRRSSIAQLRTHPYTPLSHCLVDTLPTFSVLVIARYHIYSPGSIDKTP